MRPVSHRLILLPALMLSVGVVQANQALNAPGKTNTIGPISADSTVHGSSYNPAANSLLVGEGKRVRYGHLSNISFYGEVGKSENMDVKIDQLVDDIRAAKWSGDDKGQKYKEIADYANGTLLPELEKGASLRAGAAVNLPATPFLVKSNALRGTVSVNAAANLQFSADLVTSPFAVSTTFKNASNEKFANVAIDPSKLTGEDIGNIDNAVGVWGSSDKTEGDFEALLGVIEDTLNNSGQSTEAVNVVREEKNKFGSTNDIQAESTITTDSAAEVRAALVSHFALGYGTSLSDWFAMDDKYGQLEGGVTLNYYNARIGRQL